MISSVKNDTIKQWNRLKKKKYREEAQQFLVEGHHLVEEAIRSNWTISTIILQEGIEASLDLSQYHVITVSDHVMQHLADTKTPQGIIAIVQMQDTKLQQLDRLLLLDSIQDPGNVGTIIRTADAAGFSGVILGNQTVDLHNDKLIRASQGSTFHIPIVQADLAKLVESLQHTGVTIWASTLEEARPVNELQIPEKLALIVGNEGSGVSPELLAKVNQRVHIPIYGQAESLNVSVASGIMLYQIAQQSFQ